MRAARSLTPGGLDETRRRRPRLAEQVRPIANSSLSRYWRFRRRSSSSGSMAAVQQRVVHRQEDLCPIGLDM